MDTSIIVNDIDTTVCESYVLRRSENNDIILFTFDGGEIKDPQAALRRLFNHACKRRQLAVASRRSSSARAFERSS